MRSWIAPRANPFDGSRSTASRWAMLVGRLMRTFGFVVLLGGCAATVDWDYPRPPSTAYDHPHTTTVGALFRKAADRHPGQSGFALVLDGSRALMARLAMADLAEKTLDAQYYIWDSDTTGRILAEHLIRAADRGVRVRILLDDHYQSEENDVKVAALDAHPNIEVRIFNPVANRRWRTVSFLSEFSRANHRMHNKLLVMDNALGVVGGRNIADIYFGVRPDQNFRDLDVTMAGPIVKDLSASFDLFWNSKWAIPVGAVVSDRLTEKEYLIAKKKLDENISAAGYPYPIDESLAGLRDRLVQIRDQFIWAPGHVYAEDPSRVDREGRGQVIYEALRQRVSETKHELLIESPYLILGDRSIEGVKALTARNIKVRILTNSAATNDVMAAHAGYAKTREELINAGAELYELRPDSNMKREWSIAAGRSRAASSQHGPKRQSRQRHGRVSEMHQHCVGGALARRAGASGQKVSIRIRDITRAMIDKTGNLPLFPGIFPDYSAPIARNSAEGRKLTLAR